MRSRSHDWTDCPFAHPGEKARRRDPRRFHYSGNACSDFRRGNCPRGDSCEFAHGVFECWLHPARYRTQVCKDGKNCKRKVCFFAHTPKQLRILPQSQSPQSPDHHPLTDHQFSLSKTKTHNCCCVYCHSSSSVSSSPTSTLMGFSHLSSNSPPLSPTTTIINSPSSTSELSNKQQQSLLGMLSYKNKLMELVSSLEAMDLNEVNSPTNTSVNDQSNYFTWGSCVSSPNYEHPQQFILSPDSTRQATRSSKDFFSEDYELNNINGGSCPDLEWVNELVM
ncbi:zinc finger protein [Macleaya cordata]|uniref:Zinc finger protein n=1 Tax=Macleaya cordata TaxID=56857 RepID=A0A200PQ74_MACCD|nr:zinc finger protein [Macleaya cordata]